MSTIQKQRTLLMKASAALTAIDAVKENCAEARQLPNANIEHINKHEEHRLAELREEYADALTELFELTHHALNIKKEEIENGFTSREDDEKSVNDHYETELHNYGN